ncbi:MAG TPA: TetR/AcrR family transcriptional regulator [Dermatophilaceae bacterium]|nr:TetR/AcrR family transcriptional regulator [Dermatophilaceae bacterium]
MTPRERLLRAVVAWFAAHGVGETSLRTLAREIGTSHRMLIYHFGSREGLLAEVVGVVERGERDVMRQLLAEHDDPYAAGAAFWAHVADAAQTFAPLFFELSGHAMQGKPYAASLRDWLAEGWAGPLSDGFRRSGVGGEDAGDLARESLAMARGLLFELAITGDRGAADAAMARYTEQVRQRIASLGGAGSGVAG